MPLTPVQMSNRQMPIVTVRVLSAFRGGGPWLAVLQDLKAGGLFDIAETYSFEEEEYRHARNRTARLAVRIRTFLLFPVKAAWRVALDVGARNTVFILNSSPFFLPWFMGWVLRSRCVILHNDLYPEALVAAGMLRPDGLPFRALRFIRRCTTSACWHVFLSDEPTRSGPTSTRCRVIPTGSGVASDADRRSFKASSGDVQVLYCGTLGLMHDIDTILTAVSHTGVPDGIQITFRISGARAEEFRIRAALECAQALERRAIVIGGPLSAEEWRTQMERAHVGLVLLSEGGAAASVPSKLYGSLATGQAVLAVVPKDSGTARLVTASRCGWVVPVGDTDGLSAALELIAQRDQLSLKSECALRAHRASFSRSAIADQWREFLHRVHLCQH